MISEKQLNWVKASITIYQLATFLILMLFVAKLFHEELIPETIERESLVETRLSVHEN